MPYEPLLMDIAKGYQENEELIAALDSVYGSGSAKYIGEAIGYRQERL